MIAQASISENKSTVGSLGNQSGKELNVSKWWNDGWNVVLRYPDKNKAQMIAVKARDAAKNLNIGYSWPNRMTFFNSLKAANWSPSSIKTKCDCDCSSYVSACIVATGYSSNDGNLQRVNPGNSTSTLRRDLSSKGWQVLTDKRYLISDSYLLPGDVILAEGSHTCINLDSGPNSGSAVIISDGSTGDFGGISTGGGLLYTIESDEDDAVMRECCYMGSNFEATNAPTVYKMSVVNYTTILGMLFAGMMQGSDTSSFGSSVSADGVSNTVAKQVIQYLTGKGLSAAAACGVCGNIEKESGFRIDAVELATGEGIGLVQWSFSRKRNLIAAVPDWRTNLTGQLNFLWGELTSSYYKSKVLDPMMKQPNNEAGCRECAKIWCIYFEAPANKYVQAEVRANTAVNNYWKKLSIQV